MDLHYLTFMERNLGNKKKLALNCVGIFNDSAAMNNIFSWLYRDEQNFL